MNDKNNVFELQLNNKLSFESKLRVLNKNNNTLGVTIPKEMVNLIGLSTKDSIKFEVVPDGVGRVKLDIHILKN